MKRIENVQASKERKFQKLQLVVVNKLDPKARKAGRPEQEEVHRQQEERQ